MQAFFPKLFFLFREGELSTVIQRLKNRLIDSLIINSPLCKNDLSVMTYKLSREFNDILKCLSSRVFFKSWYYGRSTRSEWASKFVNRFTSGWPSLVLVSETHWRIRSYLQNFEIPEYFDIQAVKYFEQSENTKAEQGH